MTKIVSNLFEIKNAAELNCEYKLFKIRGLNPDSEEYKKNAQYLVDTISRRNNVPAVICYKDGEAYLAQPSSYPDPPESLPLIRTIVYFHSVNGTFPLRFDRRNQETDILCIRFLQFALQRPFYNSKDLWQPESGRPFFYKETSGETNNAVMYNGFAFRIISLENGSLCICVDITSKYVSKEFLPASLSRNNFRNIKGSKCIYHFGNRWYEIKLDGYHDLIAKETVIVEDGDCVPLIEYIKKHSSKPYPKELIQVPDDCAVLIYHSGKKEERHVPSSLCRLTFDTESPEIMRLHRRSILSLHKRYEEIMEKVNTYFRNLSFNGVDIKLSKTVIVEK